MKKILILFLFTPVFLNAQQSKIFDDIFIGIQAGLNFSDYLNPIHYRMDTLSQSSKPIVPLIGANVTFPFNRYLNLRIGAVYSLKGTDYLYPESIKIRYSYFDFPTMIQIKPGNFFRLEAGVVPSVLMSSKAYFHAAADSVDVLPKTGSGIEMGVHLGAEVTLQKGWDIGFCYEMPTSSSSFSNYKFTITYSFNRDIFNKSFKINSNVAYMQIKEIKDNAILVRLKTSENQINALRKMGRSEEAAQLEKKQRRTNLEIMNAFKKNFTFCPVFFFYSSSTGKIKHANYKGCLLNDSLIADTSIRYNFNTTYIAEFDFIDPDTIYTDRTLTDQRSYKSDSSYAISNSHLEEALVVRNTYFTQLKEPFPSFVRMSEWMKRKTYSMAVATLNQQLFNFYKLSMQSDFH
jgi:hypothetical protein